MYNFIIDTGDFGMKLVFEYDVTEGWEECMSSKNMQATFEDVSKEAFIERLQIAISMAVSERKNEINIFGKVLELDWFGIEATCLWTDHYPSFGNVHNENFDSAIDFGSDKNPLQLFSLEKLHEDLTTGAHKVQTLDEWFESKGAFKSCL